MGGSYFIAQTSKFKLIHVTAVTLGRSYRKVIQYISRDPYTLCAKHVKFSSNGFDVRGKRFKLSSNSDVFMNDNDTS